MKLCKDCKWYREGCLGSCTSPEAKKDIPDKECLGKNNHIIEWISHKGFNIIPICRKEARWFEPKENGV